MPTGKGSWTPFAKNVFERLREVILVLFFDTSVLVASSNQSHPQFAQAFAAVARVVAGKDRGFFSLHSIAEMYASLTRMPVLPRIHPIEAKRIIRENILEHFSAVPLIADDYLEALNVVSGAGWSGAKIYDALILRSAEKSKAQRIYTFNLKDFKEMAPKHLQARICAP